MGLGEKLRYQIFWLVDFLKGHRLKELLNYTRKILSKRDFEYVNLEIKSKLAELLAHATTTTTFYEHIEPNSLDNFPIINKNLIRDNFEDFKSSTFSLNSCVKVSTSGSTGAPFSIYQNKTKVNKNVVDNIYFSAQSNFKVGNHLVYIKIWKNSFNIKMRYSFKMKNIYPCSIFNLSNLEIDKLIKKLNKSNSPISFIGYSSAFEKICNYLDGLEENPIKFKTISLITISEALNHTTRKSVFKYFNIKPISRYSNNENGIIAQQIDPDDTRFRINDSSYVIEIFDLNKDEKLGNGKLGRIVITDLYNKVNPIIRYDTGDVGIMKVDQEGKPYFTHVYGRKLDLIYDTMGMLVPSHISARLVNYGNFKQFQFVQKGLKQYEINLNTETKVNENELIKEFQSYLGSNAEIKINYVSEIPILASGKRREVVNEYYNQL
ncbi:MAG: CoF synthetase [Winogradskyella sp.]|uniref:CoF synthetase n=1 Tax=Winogradskyella sp. TaxID=1883156 RepID=UPI0017A0FB83|nr:CoF synthetase [Winogradskyella sp.]